MCKQQVSTWFTWIHNWWLSFTENHSNWKLVIQLFFGAILSFAGAVLLSKIQFFINFEGWNKFYSYWWVESMPGLIYITLAIIVGLYIILSINSHNNKQEREERQRHHQELIDAILYKKAPQIASNSNKPNKTIKDKNTANKNDSGGLNGKA